MEDTIPSPVKSIESNRNDKDDDIENKMLIDEIETKPESSPIETEEKKTDLNPMTILLANGQLLLTNFEEKYLINMILKTPNKDIEIILQEKIHLILQMNYGLQSTLFPLNTQWIFDFLLKHFQTLINHIHSQEFFDKILKKISIEIIPQSLLNIGNYKHWLMTIREILNNHRIQKNVE